MNSKDAKSRSARSENELEPPQNSHTFSRMALQWWDTFSGFSTGVPFAVDSNGAWRDVDDVPRGKACGCYCAECQGPLIARQGEVRVHHFAHDDRRECKDALESSLFGMAVEILKRPGERLKLPGSFTVDSVARRASVEAHTASRAVQALGLSPFQKTLVLSEPRAACSNIRDSRKSVADLTDPAQDFALHILSSRKLFYVLEKESQAAGMTLALNPVVFARRWYDEVCDPDRGERMRAAARATEQFRDWLANSVDGRGWVHHREELDVAERVRVWADAHRVTYVTPPRPPPPPRGPAMMPNFEPTFVPKPPPPNEPDKVVVEDADTCRACGSTMDVVLKGSGIFAGKRLVICRKNPRHPMRHVG